jgi:tripartite-type tricarboxylate transporter receptor subunit TctC
MRRFAFVVVAGCAVSPLCQGIAYAAAGSADAYPSRPIRVIIPYPPGGTSDILARLIGSKLTDSWKQQVIVDNRTGANGNIGLELGARATPDAYTVC